MTWEYKTLFFGAGQSSELRRYDGRYCVLQPLHPLPGHKIRTEHALEIKLSDKVKNFIATHDEIIIMPFREENAWLWGWDEIDAADFSNLMADAWHGEDRDVWHPTPGWERSINNGGQIIDEEAR